MPRNPELLLCDSDALLQVFVCRQRRALAALRTKCGITAAVVGDVEREVRNNSRYRQQFEHEFKRTVEAGNLLVLNTVEMKRLLHGRALDDAAITETIAAYRARTEDYSKHVGAGEAASHAAAVELGLPILSHDMQAVKILQRYSLRIGVPVLRLFDLLHLAHQLSEIGDPEIEASRTALRQKSEWIPPPFNGPEPAAACMSSFSSRLRIAAAEAVSPPPRHFDSVLFIEVA